MMSHGPSCPLCGGAIDGKTKRCAGCGMPYGDNASRIRKPQDENARYVKDQYGRQVHERIRKDASSFQKTNARKESSPPGKKAARKAPSLLVAAVWIFAVLSFTANFFFSSRDHAPEPTQRNIPAMPASSKIYGGEIGTTFSTAFFDFTVDKAGTDTEGLDKIPVADDKKLVAVYMAVTNTFPEEIVMYDGDFLLKTENSETYPLPLQEDPELILQFDSIYYLKPGEKEVGILIYEVPKDTHTGVLSYTEIFEDNHTGSTFEVKFDY
jgi:hypothetical protein